MVSRVLNHHRISYKVSENVFFLSLSPSIPRDSSQHSPDLRWLPAVIHLAPIRKVALDARQVDRG